MSKYFGLERIWAFHKGPMVGLFIGKEEVGTNVSAYIRFDLHEAELATARAEGRKDGLREAMEVALNTGGEKCCEAAYEIRVLIDKEQPAKDADNG